MKTKLHLIIIGIFLSVHSYAGNYYPEPISQDQPWSVIASVGEGKYPHVYPRDRKTPLGRLALGNELVLTGDLAWGMELGFQNGNQMRLDIPKETLTVLKLLPVSTSLGPMLDLLVTAKSDPLAGSSFFAQLKGGVAYRRWQIKYNPIRDLSQLAGEIQAGFGYPVTALANLSLLYQGIFGCDPDPEFNASTKALRVSNIPALHGILLGLTFNL